VQLTESDALIAHARIGSDGRIKAADPRLLALQAEAGGAADGIVAVPPIASIARLARTLGIVVSRGIVVGGMHANLDLWVRAQPDNGDVKLAISGWQPVPQRVASPEFGRARDAIFDELDHDGVWSCDAALRLLSLEPCFDDQPLPSSTPITAVLRFEPDDDGEVALLNALASQTSFAGQPASLRGQPTSRLVLQGDPARSDDGQFAGFTGRYRWLWRGDTVRAKQADPVVPSTGLLPEGIEQSLRGPLDRIIRDADAIAQKTDGPLRQDYAGYATDIAAASRHMLGIVDDLGDLQAIEAQGFAVEDEAIDVAEIVRRAASLLRVRAADRGVTIDASDANFALMARGDYRRTLQILVNLIGNAVRYAPTGTAIWVRIEEEGDLAAVIVADQGHGIASVDLDRIFGKFERVDPNEPGTSGLGLYISRRLARAMGGDITVDSAPGQGARFVLTLLRNVAA
jgi:anti-sigma regulatory factor (Ser/Thr protein kinase)